MFETIQKFFHWASTLPFVPKVLLSIAVVVVAALALAVMWVPQQPSSAGTLWPDDKSMEGLRRRLDRISKENATLLKVVAQSGQYGVYVNELSGKLHISRDEAVYRAKDLQTQGLVEVLSLTDLNIRLNDDVRNLPGGKTPEFIVAYLK